VQGREIQHQRQVIRQFVRDGLELEHRHAALTGVAVPVVRQVQRAAPPQVKRLHVVPGDGIRRGAAQPVKEYPERPLAGSRRRTGCLGKLAQAVEQGHGRVLQQRPALRPRQRPAPRASRYRNAAATATHAATDTQNMNLASGSMKLS